MNMRTVRNNGLALLLGIGVQVVSAQTTQNGTVITSQVINTVISQLQVISPTVPLCGNGPYCYVKPPYLSMAQFDPSYNTAEYFSLPAGNGEQSFDVSFVAQYADPMQPINEISVLVDGAYCSSCTAYRQLPFYAFGTNPVPTTIRVTHFEGNAWDTDGVKEFTLRCTRFGSPAPVLDILFRVVMVGTAYTEVLGHYDAPSMPLFILRDPPGDASYSSLSTGSTTCFGNSHSVNAGQEQNAWFKAKVGVAGEVGLLVTSDFELYFEGGVDVTASQSETSTYEYQTCLESATEFTTANAGTPDDLYIGSAVRYAYGMAQTVERPACGTVDKYAHFASTPVEVLTAYHYNESYIINTVIPDMEQDIAAMQPGTPIYDRAVNQLGVWHQALAINALIKENAPMGITRSFNGGNAGLTYTQQTTTSESRAIEYTAILDEGLTAEMAVEAGGTGLSAGGSIRMRTEYGNGEENSNVATNTMAYHLEDGDVFDNLTVEVRPDNTFGSYVFILDSADSRTSCRYEGGYALDQPSISVGTPGNTGMTVNEAPIGSTVNFPLIICNNSDTTRTYYLKFAAVTNAQGAVLSAFGNTLNSNDDGVDITLIGGQCINANLQLTQPNASVVDFSNINVYLYSLCDEEYPPYIRSYVSLSAHYGTGNFGTYCIPTSAIGPTEGDWVDGVQVAAINNMSTGGFAAGAYTDYSGQFSTALSRASQQLITLTGGTFPGDFYAAWIDYDHSGTFEPAEKLGELVINTPFASEDIAFTVPNSAALGSTLLRVRCAWNVADLDPCVAYDYGETEDYAVVINANTPQDCMGMNNGTALPGTACSDGNATTGSDTWNANCSCVGIALDCAGTPGGTAVPGAACDDGDAATSGDVYSEICTCAGALIDCMGVVGGTSLPGTACDDGDIATAEDVYASDCFCTGLLIDCQGVPGGNMLPGTSCDDGNPLSGGDVYTENCLCAGEITLDCNGVEDGTAQPGTACDDGDPATGDDLFAVNCVCAGEPYDCAGTPGGGVLPGTPCDDANPESQNDVLTADCTCVGVLPSDCAGVAGGTAQPGTACDDGNGDTGNDTYNAFCECVGEPLDCEGVAGGFILPGSFCNDGEPATGGDAYSLNCVCSGQPYDCEGNPGGVSTPGTTCDDGNPDTDSDVYSADCICAGTLTTDCEGTVGGPAQPGTSCDDADANTGNDVYTTNCICAGALIDCEGTIGGVALPGSACNDGDECTATDILDGSCTCAGTALPISTIAGDALVYPGTTNTYSITPVPGATGYSWSLPNVWSSNSTTDFVLIAQAGTSVGAVSLCVDVQVGNCVLNTCLPVNVELSTGMNAGANTSERWFTVLPNPSNGLFQFIPAGDQGAMNVTVYDATGRTVKAAFQVAGKRTVTIDLDQVDAGTYYLMATRDEEQRIVPVVVVR